MTRMFTFTPVCWVNFAASLVRILLSSSSVVA
jgi:hypothetical protein